MHLETTDFPSSAREEPVDTGQIKVHRGFEAIGEGMVGVVCEEQFRLDRWLITILIQSLISALLQAED